MLKASKRSGASFVVATAALSLFALHCSSEDTPLPGGSAGTGNTSGSATGGTTAGGSATGGGGSGTSGSATAGSTSGGGGAGGSAAGGGGGGGAGGGATGGGGAGGSGGATGGGGAGGSGGATGGGGSGGGSTATFAQVKTILSTSCAGNMCHSEPSQHIDWVTEAGLYDRLTTMIGNKGADCKGSIPVVKGMPNDSLLVQILKGANPAACKQEGGATQMVARMPNMCGSGQTPCLSEDKIKTISDWIQAGAPQ